MSNKEISKFSKKQKNDINNKACYTCAPGASFELCRTFPSARDGTECKKQCKDNYGASSYYYDKKGTRYCYCGNTKASCDQYDHLTEDKDACNELSKDECMLIPGSIIKGADGKKDVVSEITNDGKCQEECNRILRSDGLYCPDKCICTDPSITPLDPEDVKQIEDVIRTQCKGDTRLFCPDGITPVLQEGDNDVRIPNNYFEYGPLLRKGDEQYAFCGCDKSVISFYNTAYKDTPKNQRPTLAAIWQKAVDDVKKITNPAQRKGELYSRFNDELKKQTEGTDGTLDVNKLKALVAFEMCRVTNDKFSRIKPSISPNPGKDPGGWLKYHLSNASSSGKLLNKGVKALVMLMLVHILFRTIVPKRGNIRESLLYALYMPHQFLQNRPADKTFVMSSLVVVMTFLVLFFYFYGTAPTAEYIGFLSGLGLLGGLSVLSHYKNTPTWDKVFLGSTSLFVILLIVVVVLGAAKDDGDKAQTLFNYFIPDSWSSIPTSGLACSLYAIILGAFLTRARMFRIGSTFGFLAILVFSFIIQMFVYLGKKENVKDNWSKGWTAYYVILIIITLVTFLARRSVNNPLTSEYFIPFVLSTVFGVLPFAISAIILNFAIASFSPAIELLFLVMYRISGFISVRNAAAGSLLLALFGKRSTDKWVMPFLPIVSHLVRIFYAITGDNKPGYFTTTSTITGVSNTDMWLS